MIHGENARRSAKKELRRTHRRVKGWSCLFFFFQKARREYEMNLEGNVFKLMISSSILP